MNLDSIVVREHSPWLPNDSASDLDVWQADDVPVLGTFRMADDVVLFVAMMGVDNGSYTYWGYVPLTPTEVSDAANLVCDSMDELWTHVARYFDGRQVIFADATDFELDGMKTEFSSEKGMFKSLIQHLQWATDYYRQRAGAHVAGPTVIGARLSVSSLVHPALEEFERADHAEEQIDSAKRLLASLS